MRHKWVVLPTGRRDNAATLRDQLLRWLPPEQELMIPDEVDSRVAKQLVPANCSPGAPAWLLLVDLVEKNPFEVLVLPGILDLLAQLQGAGLPPTLEQLHAHMVRNSRAGGEYRSGIARIQLAEPVEPFLRRADDYREPAPAPSPETPKTPVQKQVAKHVGRVQKSDAKLVDDLRRARGNPRREDRVFSQGMSKRHADERKLLASFSPPDLYRELAQVEEDPLVDLPGLHPSSRDMLRTALLVKNLLDRLESGADYSAAAGFWKALEMECNRCVVDGARAALGICEFGTAEEAVPSESPQKIWALNIPHHYKLDLAKKKRPRGLKDLTLGQVYDVLDAADPARATSPKKRNSLQSDLWLTALKESSWNFLFADDRLREVIVVAHAVRNAAAHTGLVSGKDAAPVIKLLSDTGDEAPFPQLVKAKQRLQAHFGSSPRTPGGPSPA